MAGSNQRQGPANGTSLSAFGVQSKIIFVIHIEVPELIIRLHWDWWQGRIVVDSASECEKDMNDIKFYFQLYTNSRANSFYNFHAKYRSIQTLQYFALKSTNPVQNV